MRTRIVYAFAIVVSWGPSAGAQDAGARDASPPSDAATLVPIATHDADLRTILSPILSVGSDPYNAATQRLSEAMVVATNEALALQVVQRFAVEPPGLNRDNLRFLLGRRLDAGHRGTFVRALVLACLRAVARPPTEGDLTFALRVATLTGDASLRAQLMAWATRNARIPAGRTDCYCAMRPVAWTILRAFGTLRDGMALVTIERLVGPATRYPDGAAWHCRTGCRGLVGLRATVRNGTIVALHQD